MSSFTRFDAPLNVVFSEEASRILKDEYHVVKEGFTYYLDDQRFVRVEKGFLSDGASIPKWLSWLIPRWGKHGQAAVLHDKLCDTYEIIVLIDGKETKRAVVRIEIDAIFYQAMAVLEVNPLVAKAIRFGVDVYRLIKNPKKPNINKKKRALEAVYAIQ